MNPRQAQYVAARLRGLTQSASYRAAGYKATGHSAEVAAGRLEALPEIAAALRKATAEVVAVATAEAKADVPWVIESLRVIAADLEQHAGTRISALKLIGDHLGAWAPVVVEIAPVQIDLEALSDAAKRSLLNALRAARTDSRGLAPGTHPA